MASRLLFESEPRSGAWNMAFDEALLEAASRRGDTVLRIYRWSEPTLSLGYFQKSLPADLPTELHVLPRVRRLSGGGAILHHHEWTYSCMIPKSHRFARRTEVLYEQVHRAIIEAFRSLGIEAALRGEGLAAETFLCFLRGDARDVLVQGRKIVGSAQRRRRGAVLQHGSVLLRRPPFAPALPGLTDLVPGLPDDPLLGSREFARAFESLLFDETPVEFAHPEDEDFARSRVTAR